MSGSGWEAQKLYIHCLVFPCGMEMGPDATIFTMV